MVVDVGHSVIFLVPGFSLASSLWVWVVSIFQGVIWSGYNSDPSALSLPLKLWLLQCLAPRPLGPPKYISGLCAWVGRCQCRCDLSDAHDICGVIDSSPLVFWLPVPLSDGLIIKEVSSKHLAKQRSPACEHPGTRKLMQRLSASHPWLGVWRGQLAVGSVTLTHHRTHP